MSPAVSSGNTRSFLERFFWRHNPRDYGTGFQDTGQDRAKFLETLDKKRFNWLVFVVAASGFLTDSYNLFASNVVLPALSFVYWDTSNGAWPFAFNVTTLAASAVGQIVFGFAADMYGRKALYGIELIIVIISTIGLLQCSLGYQSYHGAAEPESHTWSITGWLLFWRCIMGFGIGAEYPLSAVIAAEWSSTQSRGRMMSAVFLMQPIGQLCAYGAGLTALKAFPDDTKVAMDKLWRYVIAIGVIPTLIALVFRIYMPESARYYFDVIRVYGQRSETDTIDDVDEQVDDGAPNARSDLANGIWHQFRWQELRNYFSADRKRWITLGSASMAWLLLDIVFYGLGFNSPGTIAKLWAPSDLGFQANGTTPWWLRNSYVQADSYQVTIANGSTLRFQWDHPFPPNVVGTPLIREVLHQNMVRAIETVSVASVLGSIAMIALINRQKRTVMLTATFLLLSAILFAVFGSFTSLFHQSQTHDVLIFFWIAISFLFSFGPNTLTFIIPAEVFPTKYRCSFYGITAASGKVGAVIAQALVFATNRQSSTEDPAGDGANSPKIRWLLLGFAICMLFGALVSLFLPQVQERSDKCPHRIENYSLEYLSMTKKEREHFRNADNESREMLDYQTSRDS